MTTPLACDLLLVDGSSYLYRAYHALANLSAPDGRASGALYGVVTMLLKLRKDVDCGLAACVFDSRGPTLRHGWYPLYKANRPPMPDDLAAQIDAIHLAVSQLGWPLLKHDGLEADDIIGHLATQAAQHGLRVLISTPDKDMAQLVEDGVTLINTMTNDRLDAARVLEKYGVRPEQMVDFLTLVGDASDNVPGVDKVGEKTAIKLLGQYGSLDNLMAHAEEVKGVVGENLRKARDWLPLGRKLVTILRDCVYPGGEDVRTLKLREPDIEGLGALYREWGFRSLQRELMNQSLSTATLSQNMGAATTQTPSLFGSEQGDATQPVALSGAAAAHATADEALRYEMVLTEAALQEWLDRIMAADLTAIDTETTGLDIMRMQLVGISLCVQSGHACYIPLRHAGEAGQLPLDTALGMLRPWLEDASKPKLGQNIKYDLHVFANLGIAVRGYVHDTMLQSYVLESHMPHNLDSLAMRHLKRTVLSYEEVCGKGASQIGFHQVPLDTATRYAAEDADLTLRLHHMLYPRIKQDEALDFVYRHIELPTALVLHGMERTGVLIDAAMLAEQTQALSKRMAELERQSIELAGQPFNLNSPTQLGQILFEKLGIAPLKKTAGGAPSTDEEVLQQLAQDHPLPKLVLEHRGLAKLRGTYTEKLPRMVEPSTGRVHSNYAQAVAVTGRLASLDPNLQNIPVRTPEGRRVREAFVAPPGYVIASADYSQIELRIMAHMAGDANLMAAFARNEDIHRATAAEIFAVPLEAVNKEQRSFAKTVNFGLIYGMGAFGLARSLGIERAAAQAYMDRYFARYPGVAQYMQQTREFARTRGYVQTEFGRRLWLPDIASKQPARRAGAERAAINAPMQGTAADLIKLAMIAVSKELQGRRTRMIMQVHDELVFEVPPDELDWLRTRIPELMTSVHQLRVPLLVDVGVGPNWERAH